MMKPTTISISLNPAGKFTGASLLLLAALGFANQANAASVSLGQPSYGGSGCPAGSASASVSPDGSALSVLFDSYTVEAGGSNPRVARKSCNLSIPVKVPNGMSVSLISADYRGFTDLPAGADARLDTEYFFGGSRGPAFSHAFRGRLSNTYTQRHGLLAGAAVWSACGADVNLRVNSGLTVSSTGTAALATVDSADFSAGMVYHLQYRSCESRPVPPPANNTPPGSHAPAFPPGRFERERLPRMPMEWRRPRLER